MDNRLVRYLAAELSREPRRDGRIILLAALICYFIFIFIGGSVLYGDYAPLWEYLGVPVMTPPFADLRLLTSGLDCSRNGIDVLSVNPCDPWNRPVNYPRIWLSLAALGIGEHHTEMIGILWASVFFISVLVLVRRLNPAETITYCLMVCSPAVMLAVERGNSDTFIFALLMLALLAGRHMNAFLSHFGTWALFLIAALLKLFPVFSLIYYVREKPMRFLLAAGSILALFGIYLLSSRADLAAISRETPREFFSSYGAFVFVDGLSFGFAQMGIELDRSVLHFLMIGLAAAVFMIMAIKAIRPLSTGDLTYDHIDSFRLGAGIFAGTFLLGNNWDYRLIFLIFTFPQMLSWGRCRNPVGKLSVGALIIILIRSWSEVWGRMLPAIFLTYTVRHILEWMLFAFFLYALMTSLPPWIRNAFRGRTM